MQVLACAVWTDTRRSTWHVRVRRSAYLAAGGSSALLVQTWQIKSSFCQECPSNSISPPAASSCTCLEGWKGDRCLIKVKGPPGPGAREFVVSFSMNLPTVVERRSNVTSAPALTAVDIMREKLAEFFSVQPDLVKMATNSRRGWRLYGAGAFRSCLVIV